MYMISYFSAVAVGFQRLFSVIGQMGFALPNASLMTVVHWNVWSHYFLCDDSSCHLL